MKSIFITILLTFTVSLNAQVVWQLQKDTVVKWSYHSGDEFNGSAIDTKMWHTGPPFGRALQHFDAYYDEANIKVADGKLSVTADDKKSMHTIEPWLRDSAYWAKQKIDPVNGNYPFGHNIGMIWSKQFYRYGYFECRFKAPAGKGLWPAFWLYGQNSKDEIDFFELKGENNKKIHVDTHCPNGCGKGYKTGWRKVNWGGWVKIDQSLDKEYNVISGIWKPGEVEWYLNGVGFAKFKGDFETAMSLIINIAVSKDGEPFSPGPDETTKFPAAMDVDYVRVYGIKDTIPANTKPVMLSYLGTDNPVKKPASIKAKRYIFKRKMFERSVGFVSLYKTSTKQIVIEQQGKFKKVLIKVYDDGNAEVYSSELLNQYNTIDLSSKKPGKYRVKIQVDGRDLSEEIIL